jgi:hypothetical protein
MNRNCTAAQAARPAAGDTRGVLPFDNSPEEALGWGKRLRAALGRLGESNPRPTHYEIVPSLTAVAGCRWLTLSMLSVRAGRQWVLLDDVG